MHNYIRWISYQNDLLKYIRDYDDDEVLSINKYDTCDSVHNYYWYWNLWISVVVFPKKQ